LSHSTSSLTNFKRCVSGLFFLVTQCCCMCDCTSLPFHLSVDFGHLQFPAVWIKALGFCYITWMFYYINFMKTFVLEFELRALPSQNRHSAAWATPLVHFALVFLEMGSHELFVQAGLEPQSSWSQPSK
jgi:hypothetical protein